MVYIAVCKHCCDIHTLALGLGFALAIQDVHPAESGHISVLAHIANLDTEFEASLVKEERACLEDGELVLREEIRPNSSWVFTNIVRVHLERDNFGVRFRNDWLHRSDSGLVHIGELFIQFRVECSISFCALLFDVGDILIIRLHHGANSLVPIFLKCMQVTLELVGNRINHICVLLCRLILPCELNPLNAVFPIDVISHFIRRILVLLIAILPNVGDYFFNAFDLASPPENKIAIVGLDCIFTHRQRIPGRERRTADWPFIFVRWQIFLILHRIRSAHEDGARRPFVVVWHRWPTIRKYPRRHPLKVGERPVQGCGCSAIQVCPFVPFVSAGGGYGRIRHLHSALMQGIERALDADIIIE